MEAAARTMDLLWMGSLSAIPLAGMVALTCRALKSRPATRHAMWLATLISFVMPLLGAMVWETPRVSSSRVRQVAQSKLGLAEALRVDPVGTTATNLEMALTRRASGVLPDSTPASMPLATPMSVPPTTPSMELPPGEPESTPPCDSLANARECVDVYCELPARVWQPFSTSVAPGVEVLPTFANSSEPDDVLEFHAESSACDAPLFPESADIAGRSAASIAFDDPSRSQPEPQATPPIALADTSPSPTFSAETSAFLSAWLDRVLAFRDSISTLPPLPTAVWLFGMIILAMIQAARTMSAAKVLRGASPASRELLAMVGSLSEQVGLAQAPMTSFVSSRVSPMIWCGLRPRLLVPSHLWDSLDDHSRRAVIVHELAHLARKDHIFCWVEIVIGALYWWHPVVWYVRRKLRDDADASCDAWVTSLLPSSRRSYAEALLTTKSFVSAPRPDAGLFLCMLNDRTKVLSRRITMVMTQRTAPKISTIGAFAAALIVGVSAFVMPGLACPPEEQQSGQVTTTATTVKSVKGAKAPKAHASAGQGGATASAPAAQTTEGVPFFGEARALEAMRAGQSKSDPFAAPRAMTVWRSGEALATPGEATTTMNGPGPGTEPRTYRLPEGKLEALAGLMSRQDVPIWVEPSDDHIVVHATPDQHKVFEAFVKMIHPDAKPGSASATAPRGRGPALAVVGVPAAPALARLQSLRASAQALEKNKRDFEREANRLRAAAEASRDNSENLRDMARQLADQAGAARDAAARDALRQTSNSLRTRSTALQSEAVAVARRIEELEARIRQLEDSLEEIERKVDDADDSDESDAMSIGGLDLPEVVIETPGLDAFAAPAMTPVAPVPPVPPVPSVAPVAPAAPAPPAPPESPTAPTPPSAR